MFGKNWKQCDPRVKNEKPRLLKYSLNKELRLNDYINTKFIIEILCKYFYYQNELYLYL